jgi:multidrug efflux pump subunit AcrA (membrane-fusion protein)
VERLFRRSTRRSNASQSSNGVQASISENSRWEPVLRRIIHATPDGASSVYAGEIRARYESDLAFRIGGKVMSRNVKVGSVVRKGPLLARLDPRDMQRRGDSARAQTAVADSNREQASIAAGVPLFIAVVLTFLMIQLKRSSASLLWC